MMMISHSICVVYVVDTFLAFFRAYRDDNGTLIYSLSRIRKNYIASGWFIANLLACIPGTIVTWSQMPSEWDDSAMDAQLQENTSLFFLFEGFKLLRLIRFNRLCETSPFMKDIWWVKCVPVDIFTLHYFDYLFPFVLHNRERLNIAHALMLKFLFLIILISHVRKIEREEWLNLTLTQYLTTLFSFPLVDRVCLGLHRVPRSAFIWRPIGGFIQLD